MKEPHIMTAVLTNLYDEKLKAYKLNQLLENKNKSSAEIQELNTLVEEKTQAEEITRDPEYAEMISDFRSGYFYSEDIDLVIGTVYGMNAHRIMKKDINDDKKEKMLKLCAKMLIGIRNASLKELKKKINSSMEQPQPYKP